MTREQQTAVIIDKADANFHFIELHPGQGLVVGEISTFGP
jgi:hypothetical protein